LAPEAGKLSSEAVEHKQPVEADHQYATRCVALSPFLAGPRSEARRFHPHWSRDSLKCYASAL